MSEDMLRFGFAWSENLSRKSAFSSLAGAQAGVQLFGINGLCQAIDCTKLHG